MEITNEASDFFKVLLWIIAIYIIYRMAMVYINYIYSDDEKCTDKRVEVGTVSVHSFKSMPAELSPKEKACVAVGICGASDIGRPFNQEEKHSWKHQIIMNAEKVFAEGIPKSKRPAVKKKRG